MTFSEALSAVFNDSEKVTRAHWNNRAIYCLINDAKQLATTWNSDSRSVDGLLHPLIVDEQDYFSEDWELIDD